MTKQKLEELEAVIGRYQGEMFRFAFFRVGTRADAQDIVQHVFLKLYDSNRNISAIENMKSYLYRAISNACSDYLRKRQSRHTVPIDHAVMQPTEECDNDHHEAEREYRRIATLLGALPFEQAEVIRMRTVDSLSFTEIAEILQIPATTAKSRFKYGIDKLKSEMR